MKKHYLTILPVIFLVSCSGSEGIIKEEQSPTPVQKNWNYSNGAASIVEEQETKPIHHSGTINNTYNKPYIAQQAQPTQPPTAYINNWSHNNEKEILSQIEGYLRNSSTLIQKAEALQNDNARIKFNYYQLKKDISDVASSIRRYIEHNQHSTEPRSIEPLTLRY